MAYYGYNPCDFDPAHAERRALQAEAAWELAFERRWKKARDFLLASGLENPTDDEIENALDAAEDAENDYLDYANEQ